MSSGHSGRSYMDLRRVFHILRNSLDMTVARHARDVLENWRRSQGSICVAIWTLSKEGWDATRNCGGSLP